MDSKEAAEILGVLTEIRFELKKLNRRLEKVEYRETAIVRSSLKRELRGMLRLMEVAKDEKENSVS